MLSLAASGVPGDYLILRRFLGTVASDQILMVVAVLWLAFRGKRVVMPLVDDSFSL